MNKRFFPLVVILINFFTTAVFAQELSDREKFTEAMYLMDERRFSTALPILLELAEKEKDNANLDYNIGLAYLFSFEEKEKVKALPYLLSAAKNTSPNYKAFNSREKRAPVDATFYLAKAQHNDYQFLEAKENLLKFQKQITEEHYLWKEVGKGLKMADYAQKAITNPVNIIVTNLGDSLNGYYPDFSPVVRIDETAIYFTSRRLRKDSSNFEIYDPIDGMLYEDLYVSFKNEDTEVWGEPYPLNINTEGHEATVNLSVDGQTLYIYKDIRGNGELYKSNLVSDSAGFETWSEPEKLGSDINSKAYETHVTVTPDGKYLYFVSDRDGGFGGKDIYYCRLLPTGEWALSQNAGPVLNSEYNEDGVFMHPDGKTMYFSSDGHESMGGYDIMYSVLSDSGWSTPTNMGYPINSVDDDVFFVTTPDGKRAYFSSFKEEGYGEKDIYMLELLDAEEKPITLYRGEFTFVDRYVPPAGALVTITNNNTGELVGYFTPRQRDGQFSAILETNNSYHFTYESAGYETYEEDIYVPASANYQEIYKDIKLRPVRVGDGMNPIQAEPLYMANVSGSIAKNSDPIKGLKILLLNEDKDLLEQTETDNVGVFNFSKLDPSKTYLIQVVTEDENPIKGYSIDILNDKGETLTFEKIDDNTYIFVPTLYPYEYYGISASAISGKVKSSEGPLSGLNVRLEDETKDLIQQEETDEYGEFNFQKLDLDKTYRIIFEGDFPDNTDIVLLNEAGDELTFMKVKEGIYEYVPVKKSSPEVVLSDISGSITHLDMPVKNLSVLLLDKDLTLLNKTATDSVGKFNFMDLDLKQQYTIKFEGDFPEDLKLVVANEDFDLLLFRKIAAGVYRYDPIFVRLENKQADVLGQEITDDVSEFNYKKLNTDEYYKIIYDGNYPDDSELVFFNDKGEKLAFKKVSDGVYEYIPIKSAGPRSYTMDVEGRPDLKETYPRPEELRNVIAYFQRYFIYNAKDINKQNKEFVDFINDIAELVEIRGNVELIITSSASKVPTKTWKTNSILTKKRAYDTKALLVSIFAERGIKPEQYNFVDINTLITGPEYKGDFDTNMHEYEKYQYVRIFVK